MREDKERRHSLSGVFEHAKKDAKKEMRKDKEKCDLKDWKAEPASFWNLHQAS